MPNFYLRWDMPAKKNHTARKAVSLPEKTRRLLSNFYPDDRVLIAITADPDAMASALAFKRLLWRRVASVVIAKSNEISRPDNLTMVRLLNIPMEEMANLDLADFDVRVILDGQPHHHEAFTELCPQVIIDHHPAGENTAKPAFVDIRPRYGATSSMMTEYLRGAHIKLSSRLATALTFGIKNDTANFQRPCLEEDLKAFQYVFPKANNSLLRKIELSELRLKDLDTIRLALERATMRKKCMFAHMGAVKSPDNLVQIADFFLRVESVDMSAVSGVFESRLIVILRSALVRQNAGKVASQAFGQLGSAGGHASMARAEMPLCDVGEFAGGQDDESLRRFVMRRIRRPSAALRKSPRPNGCQTEKP